MRALAIVAVIAATAHADPLRVTVRDGGLAVERLRGQLADLEVDVQWVGGTLEPTLDGQLSAAAKLGGVVVWFAPHDGGLAVAVATPGRLFVREIPAGEPSSVAEAAAIAARGAIKAIALGGTIGVELPAPMEVQPPSLPPEARPSPPLTHRPRLEAALGWQVALDGGADRGAQALAQRTTLARGDWAASLALALGASMRHDGSTTIELSRSGALLGIERRFGAFAVGVSVGALRYHRTTVSTDLTATPDASTLAFVAAPEVSWRFGGRLGLVATAGLDLVAGAPDPVAIDAGVVESVAHVHAVQPRISLSVCFR